jgi:hypothetical protein
MLDDLYSNCQVAHMCWWRVLVKRLRVWSEQVQEYSEPLVKWAIPHYLLVLSFGHALPYPTCLAASEFEAQLGM